MVPCVGSVMTCFDSRVVWRAKRGRRHWQQTNVALTIDDVPLWLSPGGGDQKTLSDLLQRLGGVGCTFFVMVDDSPPRAMAGVNAVSTVNMIAEKVRDTNARFEVGIHRKGRWGWFVNDGDFIAETQRLISHVHLQCELARPKYARLPGGFSRPQTVDALDKPGLKLKVVNGTAYPFDADLCECLPPSTLGWCGARMAVRDGQIAILHYDQHIGRKVASFLEEIRKQGKHDVVPLHELFKNERDQRPECAPKGRDPPLLSVSGL